MGTPIPIPPPSGENCSLCDTTLWIAGQTPKFVEAKVWDTEACPGAPAAAPNGLYILEQDPNNWCSWWLYTSDYFLNWFVTGILTDFKICEPTAPYTEYFYERILLLCQTSFTNSHTSCIGNYGKNGEVVVTPL